jgi:hypothetical protein
VGSTPYKYKDFHWKWTIDAGSYMPMKAWSCPDDVRWIGTDTKADIYEGGDRIGQKGLMTASASSGTGYGGFDHVTVDEHPEFTRKYYFLTGWPEGGFWYNSIWAPPGEKGHFELTVRCVNKPEPSAGPWAAWITDWSRRKALFPWIDG